MTDQRNYLQANDLTEVTYRMDKELLTGAWMTEKLTPARPVFTNVAFLGFPL